MTPVFNLHFGSWSVERIEMPLSFLEIPGTHRLGFDPLWGCVMAIQCQLICIYLAISHFQHVFIVFKSHSGLLFCTACFYFPFSFFFFLRLWFLESTVFLGVTSVVAILSPETSKHSQGANLRKSPTEKKGHWKVWLCCFRLLARIVSTPQKGWGNAWALTQDYWRCRL